MKDIIYPQIPSNQLMVSELASIFAIITSIAAVVSTFFSLRTLREMRAQREATYRPSIIIESRVFYIYSYVNNDFQFAVEYSYEKKDIQYKASQQQIAPLPLNLYNIGLGTAKSVVFEISLDISGLIKNIEALNQTLPREQIIRIRKEENFIHLEPPRSSNRGRATHRIDNQLRHEINYILPVNVSPISTQVVLPHFIFELYSILIYNFWISTDDNRGLLEFPPIHLSMTYLDIANNRQSKDYKIYLTYHGGTVNESMNSLSVKEA